MKRSVMRATIPWAGIFLCAPEYTDRTVKRKCWKAFGRRLGESADRSDPHYPRVLCGRIPICWSQSFNENSCWRRWALRRTAAISLRACLRAAGSAGGPSAARGPNADGARAADSSVVTRGVGIWGAALPGAISARGRRAVDISGGADHDGSGESAPFRAPPISPGKDCCNPAGGAPAVWTGAGSTRAVSSAVSPEGRWRMPGADPETRLSVAGLPAAAIDWDARATGWGPLADAACVASRGNSGLAACALTAAPGGRAAPSSGAASIE